MSHKSKTLAAQWGVVRESGEDIKGKPLILSSSTDTFFKKIPRKRKSLGISPLKTKRLNRYEKEEKFLSALSRKISREILSSFWRPSI